MTEAERKLLAKDIAAEIHLQCPLGWTAREVENLRGLSNGVQAAKKVAAITAVTLLVTGFVGVFVLGVIQWFRERLPIHHTPVQ